MGQMMHLFILIMNMIQFLHIFSTNIDFPYLIYFFFIFIIFLIKNEFPFFLGIFLCCAYFLFPNLTCARRRMRRMKVNFCFYKHSFIFVWLCLEVVHGGKLDDIKRKIEFSWLLEHFLVHSTSLWKLTYQSN